MFCSRSAPKPRLLGATVNQLFRRFSHVIKTAHGDVVRNRTVTSNLFVATQRTAPGDAVIASHALLVRAGYIRQTAAGVWTLMPPAYRVLEKIKSVIADELDKRGCAQIAMPCLQPSTIWKKSGRWETSGHELFRLQDRKGSDYCLGPTHEEVVTELVAAELSTYRQLPLRLYQMDRKFRDELRPRFGLMRGREFWMKDMYSFDENEDAARVTYDLMCEAYMAIMARLGLTCVMAEADTGNIGGKRSHEFHVLSKVGEDIIIHCKSCSYVANREKAVGRIAERAAGQSPGSPVDFAALVDNAVDGLQAHVYMANGRDKQCWIVVTTSDQSVNDIKLHDCAGASDMHLLTIDQARDAVQRCIAGSMPGTIIIDESAGIDEIRAHAALAVKRGDVRNVKEGDLCVNCDSPLSAHHGIEVGHAFHLGTKYSEVFQCRFKARDGSDTIAEMGCYGLGLTRILQIENHHDDHGLVWPKEAAPYAALIVPLGAQKDDSHEEFLFRGERLYDRLVDSAPWLAKELVLDDRLWMGPGAKLKDAQLYGYPTIIVVGTHTQHDDNLFEVQDRSTGKSEVLHFNDLLHRLGR